jgi:hypothetical protein
MLLRFREERGIAMITAMIVSMVLMATASAVVGLSIHNSNGSSLDRKRLQAVNTAEAGLSSTMSLLQTTATAALPCTGDASLHGTLPTDPASEYTATIDYYNVYPPSGTPMTCAGATSEVHTAAVLPKAAAIVSKGTAVVTGIRGAQSRTMETLVRLRPIRSGFNQAIFSDTGLDLTNNLSVIGNVGNDGDIYTNGNWTCSNSSNIKGSVLVQGSGTMSSSCTVAQDVWAAKSLSMSNSATIGHDATASGAGYDITMANTSFVTHNATAGRNCSGCSGRVGAAITANSVSNPPPHLDLPKINYVAADWLAGDADAGIPPYTIQSFATCTGATANAISTGWTSPTVARISPACGLTFSNNSTINVQSDLAIITDGSLTTVNQNNWQGVGGTHNLYIIVPWEATTAGNLLGGTPVCTAGLHDISISNNTNFVNLKVFIYSPCTVTYNNNNSGLGGQVLAGTVNITNLYTLAFSPLLVPGAGQVRGYKVDIAYVREIVNS